MNLFNEIAKASKPQPKQPKPKKLKLTRKEKDAIMASLGLVKVRGPVSGKIYYE